MSVAPPSPLGLTPASTNAEGFLLLTISNATLTSSSPSHKLNGPLKGLLSLECVTVSVSDPVMGGRDVWLVMRVDPSGTAGHSASFELPLPATQKIMLSRKDNRYTLPMLGSGELVLSLPTPSTPAEKEDLETLEVILAQYAVLQTQEDTTVNPLGSTSTAPPPPTGGPGLDGDGNLKGRLVLVDEDNGQVVGTLEDQFDIREDAALHLQGNEKMPVVVEISEEEALGSGDGTGTPRVTLKKTVFVHPVSVEDSHWVSQTAGFIGRGMVLATNAVSSGVTAASNYYVSKATPRAEPIVFSENTRKNVKRIHAISGKAVVVTSKTTGLIHQTVEKLANKVGGAGKQAKHSSTQGGGYTPAGSTSSASSVNLKPGEKGPPAYSPLPAPGSSSQAPPPLPPRRLLNRLLTSTDMLLTTLEASAQHLITTTTNSLSHAAEHKYGPDVGQTVGMMGEGIRNVGVVYIDARGVGRRALLRTAGKRVIKARLGGKDGREVVFQDQGMGHGIVIDHQVLDEADKRNAPPPSDNYAPPPFPPAGPKPGRWKPDNVN